jgi:cellobiose-specific phosphotransferase system component IIC
MIPGRILCYVVMIIQWVVVYKVNKTTIAVISAHARFISAMPILLLGCLPFTLQWLNNSGPADMFAAQTTHHFVASQLCMKSRRC